MLTDHDSFSSAPGSPAGFFSSLLATTGFSQRGAKELELLTEDRPTPTLGPITESSASPPTSPESSAELATVQSQHQPPDANSTSEATLPHTTLRSHTFEFGTRASQTAVEQRFATRPQDVTRTYARRNRRSARGRETGKSSFGPFTLSSDEHQGVMYHRREVDPEPFYSEGNDFLPSSPRMVLIHSVLSKVEEMPSKGESRSNISKCMPDLPSTLHEELAGTWVDGQGVFVSRLFQRLSRSLPNTKKVYAFLQQYRRYLTDEEKWENVPLNPARENIQLYEALVKHINAILEHFIIDPSRRAANTSNKVVPHHSDGDDKDLESKPDIVVLGYGSCLTKEQEILSHSYAQCLAPIEVNIQKDLDVTTHRIQLAVYARECFGQQPNRRFVYGLLLTEKTGIICAISGKDEREVGLDPRIFWRGKKRYFDNDRQFYWVTQPFYGPPIDQFASVPELFQAFHDAITGSKKLTDIGILHRDMSPRNILLDRRGLGTFGTLIDFDIIAKIGREESGVHTDFRTGTRAFQSLKVLSGRGNHEPLDELESCFYSYSWIIFSYEEPQRRTRVLPEFLVEWQSEDVTVAIQAKMQFIMDSDIGLQISPGMGNHTLVSFLKLQRFFRTVTQNLRRELQVAISKARQDASSVNERVKILQGFAQAGPSLPQPLINQAEVTSHLTAETLAHYTSVLAMVREAVDGEMEAKEKRLPLPVPQIAQTSRAQPAYGHAPQANFLVYSTTHSYSSGHSNKRSPSPEQDDVIDLVQNKRGGKRAKVSHSEFQDP
ncbi:hypothetical protein NEOLEDRAFT_1176718 [Neolentinus lepideus HHB14362 ss-1]|uniref:Fungal-type protein kinase domain-containing protein n=1 Tax=Neolentinus lepideus HHB14362 ss-1 TaxID=1314782 RepID=A0A165TWP1_9AGAM|nr:hypothetical protein NEOLEDRAFT_1176718 [Neolentinus lepideus HHB14362 ss-1]